MKFKLIIIIFCIIIIICLNEKNKFYKNIKLVTNPNKIDVLVNKNNILEKYYHPYDLKKINEKYSNKNKYLRKEACKQFEKMAKDALKQGYYIKAISTYRSYFYQKELYNHYIKTMGKKKALIASAKPGHSEHQTGLAVDISGSFGDYNNFDKTPEFKWVKNNSYKYGFILRFPKGKEKTTGFKYEPWHYRYVGIKKAKYIYLNNLTLEEYKNQIFS